MIDSAVMSNDELIDFAEGLARIASTGGGPKALAAHLATLIDAAVLVEDAEWRHVALAGASSGARSVPPTGRELIAAAPKDNETTLRLQTPGNPQGGIAVRIRGGEAPIGWLSVFPSSATAAEGRIGAIRLTAAAIAVELSRDAGGGKNRRKSFWDRLISRTYDDPIEAKDDAAARGIALASGYVAIAIEAEGLEESVAAAKMGELRRIALETLRSGQGDIAVLERGGGFVFLCPAPLEVDAANVRTAATLIPRSAAKVQFGAKIVGGVGRPADAIAAHRTVDEARESMFIARRLFGGSRVMPYEDLGVYPLLLRGGATSAELRTFSDRILAPLRAYDEKHQTELIRTLRLYFDVGQNVKTAAAELSVHRHTVFYRLRQIAEISEHDLDSAHDQLTLRTAMAIDALDSHER
ncbi:MAG: helix-turn-helix domain-containing protein [Candidatus Eremiobacteraeota bacterium]|nr:helix-turn-helix domain-containing protein [Candidatus Eremiobacteraeota bacterium]